MTPDLQARIDRLYAERDRDHMRPTIEAFEALAAAHPGETRLLYDVAGAYDSAGDEPRARVLYERALAAGLDGEVLGRCLLQYGSTLRNLGEFDASLAAFDRAAAVLPDAPAVAVFRSLTLLELGRGDGAVGTLLRVIATSMPAELGRYRASVAGNAEFLLDRDAAGSGGAER